MKRKCHKCNIKEIIYSVEGPNVCIECFPAFLRDLPYLSCKEKGHTNNMCGCPDMIYVVGPSDFPDLLDHQTR